MKTERAIAQIKKALLPYQAERIYLFGSLARGEGDDLNDVDLVIIKETAKPFWDRLREASTLLSAELKTGVDLLVYTPEEFSQMLERGNAFAQMISEEALLIYDQQTQE